MSPSVRRWKDGASPAGTATGDMLGATAAALAVTAANAKYKAAKDIASFTSRRYHQISARAAVNKREV